MANRPIFILGSERSGTNLLRTRLDNHSNIAGPTPPHILKWLYDVEPYYGNLKVEKNFKILIKDLIDVIKTNIAPWDIKLTVEKINNDISLEERSVLKLFEYVFDKYTEKEDKDRWFCKDTDLSNYAWKLRDYFLDAKFIYLVRDPRDVCLSDLKRNTGSNTAYTFALRWREEQNKCIRLYTDEAFENRILLIKYEDILSNTEDTFTKVCEFIGEDFEPQMLHQVKMDQATKTNNWKNISKKILKNNKKKYKAGLTEKQIKIVEKIAKKPMKFLEYDFEFKDNNYHLCNFKKYYYEYIEETTREYIYKTRSEKEEYRIGKKRQKLRKKINNRLLI